MKKLIKSALIVSILSASLPLSAHKDEEIKIVYVEKGSTGRSIAMFALGSLTTLLAVGAVVLYKTRNKKGIQVFKPSTYTAENLNATAKQVDRKTKSLGNQIATSLNHVAEDLDDIVFGN